MKLNTCIAAAVAVTTFASAANAAVVDTLEAGTGFFTPAGSELSSPYYRGASEDWGWTHNAIASGFTSASLNISAYDVDETPCGFFNCEVDNIEAYDAATSTWILLGALTGDDNAFSFTEFDIYAAAGGALIDDIETGLQVRMDIDANNGGWLVSLAKSVITTDGADPGNPNPSTVPLPAAGWLLFAGVGAMAAAGRRKKSA